MKQKTAEEIKEFARTRLVQQFGFCGVMESDNKAILTSTDHTSMDIKIIIEVENFTEPGLPGEQ